MESPRRTCCQGRRQETTPLLGSVQGPNAPRGARQDPGEPAISQGTTTNTANPRLTVSFGTKRRIVAGTQISMIEAIQNVRCIFRQPFEGPRARSRLAAAHKPGREPKPWAGQG